MEYSLTQFTDDMKSMQPRFFDVYLLPGFMCWFAYTSKDKNKIARRLLFSAGVYMAMRNFGKYQEALQSIAAMVKQTPAPAVSPDPTAMGCYL